MPFPSATSYLLALPRSTKRLVALAADAVSCVLTVWIAYDLRFGHWSWVGGNQWYVLAAALLLAPSLLALFGTYRAITRYTELRGLKTIAAALTIYGFIFTVIFAVVGVPDVPRTIGIIQPVLLLLCVCASRIIARELLESSERNFSAQRDLPRVLIYGAGSAGRQLAEALRNSGEMNVVGFLDDNSALHGNTINGIAVFAPGDLGRLIPELKLNDLLLAIPSVTRARRNEILGVVAHHPIRIRTLPGLMDLAFGRVQASDIRDLDIEDILSRDTVPPNETLLNNAIHGKTVLVTGAGGSIGSELCRQIAKLAPATLLLIEHSEFALYSIHEELSHKVRELNGHGFKIVPLLASAGDYDRINEIMAAWSPDSVYHAAAYKHVPLVEHNPAEGVRNNVFGTLNVARAAIANQVKDFVLVSTDKAVRPTNVMGASKRLAEMVLQGLAAWQTSPSGNLTRFSMVRFGNVLGSSGSVVPLFRQQIDKGGPVTLTHPDITRYFMTIPEAAQLVIQAGALAGGGDLFMLDMGQPVKIQDLARRMIELSGLRVKDEANPSGDIEIVITRLRPGEKLFEELLISADAQATEHPRIVRAHEEFVEWPVLRGRLDRLKVAVGSNDVAAIRSMLKELVSGYKPEVDVVDWVHMEQENKLAESANSKNAVA